MSEIAIRNTFKKHVTSCFPTADFQRLELRNGAGVPDINICLPSNGEYSEATVEWWVEAKYLPFLPIRSETPIRVHLRKEQAIWLNRRKSAGGRCLVLVRIAKEKWAVFDGHFNELRDGMSPDLFFGMAKWVGSSLDIPAIFKEKSKMDNGAVE